MTPIAPTTASPATATGADPLASLSSNFSNFLNLLMTQLKNQDPSSPMVPIRSPPNWCNFQAWSSRSTRTPA